MNDTISRFSTRVENYSKYRPGYPTALIDLLRSKCGLTRRSVIADVGSGTGILAEMFLKNGNRVFGVEPNSAMRATAERLLKNYSKFVSIDGAAESTNLEPNSVNFVTAGQAFHWFQRREARAEFIRILKPEACVVLIWNERRLDSTPFLRAYEQLLLRYGTDYERVRHENVKGEIADFFAPQIFSETVFENLQHLDFESFKGRVLSASYTPEPNHPDFEPMIALLHEIFEAHQRNGHVTCEYNTRIYYGPLTVEGEG